MPGTAHTLPHLILARALFFFFFFFPKQKKLQLRKPQVLLKVTQYERQRYNLKLRLCDSRSVLGALLGDRRGCGVWAGCGFGFGGCCTESRDLSQAGDDRIPGISGPEEDGGVG